MWYEKKPAARWCVSMCFVMKVGFLSGRHFLTSALGTSKIITRMSFMMYLAPSMCWHHISIFLFAESWTCCLHDPLLSCINLEYDWSNIYGFLQWLSSTYCTESLLWSFSQNWWLSEDIWKSNLWLSSQEKSIVNSVHSYWCRQWAGQCSSWVNGETSCWCFHQANS